MSLVAALSQRPLVAILRRVPAAEALRFGLAAATAGVGAVEVTMDGDDALDALRLLADRLPATVLLGAGTVTSPSAAEAAYAAGAAFIVCPTLDLPVVAAGHSLGIPVIPGAMTPTEIRAASDAGADVVKLFPAGPLGPGFVRAIQGPLPHIPLLCTGGISVDSARAFLDAGALAVGLGSDLVNNADADELAARVAVAMGRQA